MRVIRRVQRGACLAAIAGLALTPTGFLTGSAHAGTAPPAAQQGASQDVTASMPQAIRDVLGRPPARSTAAAPSDALPSTTAPTVETVLDGGPARPTDYAGYSVAVSGAYAVVGAPLADTAAGADSGAAYVLFRTGTVWSQQAVLTASDGVPGDLFGYSVAISGSYVVIGAAGHDEGSTLDVGAAYVFLRTGTSWAQQARVLSSDGGAGDLFGLSVGISGSYAVVGSPANNPGGNDNAGAAYVFKRAGTAWTQQAKLVAADGAAFDLLGWSVSIAGAYVIAGAYSDSTTAGADAGSAYVFFRTSTSWAQQAHLFAGDAASLDAFGYSVSIAGTYAIVGAPNNNTLAGGFAGSAYVFKLTGTVWAQQAELFASDAAANDSFGFTVGISGAYAIVGATYDTTTNGSGAGSSYVFLRSGTTWTQQAHLLAADGAASDSFGFSVAISGAYAVVGAYFDDTPAGSDSGSEYAYWRSGTSWIAQTHFEPAGAGPDTYFGTSVALSDTTAVVGSYGHDTTAGVDAGSASVFVRSGSAWIRQATLYASDAAANDLFGYAVAISGQYVIVGAPGDNSYAGSAYVFKRTGTAWAQQAKLTVPGASVSDLFGAAVSISGAYAAVGAFGDDTAAGSDAGSAYVFFRTGTSWAQQAALTALDSAANDSFGFSVAIDGIYTVIGAYTNDTTAGSNAGSAYVFKRTTTTWSQQAELTASDAAAGDLFGGSVAIDGAYAVVGAYADTTTAASNAGSAYVFFRVGTAWGQQAHLTAGDAAGGDFFGWSVAISGANVVVSALHGDGAVTDSGSAYRYLRSGTAWAQQAELSAASGASYDGFGISVAIFGADVIVGAYTDTTSAGANAGTAHIFE